MDMEFKSVESLEIKTINDGEMAFSGYAAYFGNVDSYGDVLEKGAFSANINRSRKGKYPAMLSQHGGYMLTSEDKTPVGIWTKMEEDENGLYVEGKLADTARGRDLYALMKMSPRPAIDGMSIGYIATDVEYPKSANDPKFKKGCVRKLKGVDAHEISIVTFPANDKAIIKDVKSEDGVASEEQMTIRQAEQTLVKEGYSNTEAKRILSLVKNAFLEAKTTPSKSEDPDVPNEATQKEEQAILEYLSAKKKEFEKESEQKLLDSLKSLVSKM